MQGRPRPVVIALPEDMLDDVAIVADAPTVVPAAPAPLPDDIARFETLLAQAARPIFIVGGSRWTPEARDARSEEHTSELQSLMRNSYADFCLKQKKLKSKTSYRLT